MARIYNRMVSWTTFAGRYRKISYLGEGVAGDVWRVRDENLGREVALKLFPDGAPIFGVRHEAQLLTTLESPHILRVFNADIYQDVPYLATEVAALGSAKDYMKLKGNGRIGVRPDFAVRWIRHLLVGLTACHDRRLLHRDIKVSNLFLADESWAQLGDFGNAAFLDSNGEADPAGAVVIQAPEFLSGGRATVLSDIYAVGATLYKLLCGRYPFGGSEARIRESVAKWGLVDIRDRAPHISRRLADRVRRAMARNPVDRYQTAEDMHAHLGAAELLPRLWEPIDPDAGHEACWIERRGGAVSRRVCVSSDHSGWSIDVRRSGGRRVRAFCRTASSKQDLAVRLRDVFDHA